VYAKFSPLLNEKRVMHILKKKDYRTYKFLYCLMLIMLRFDVRELASSYFLSFLLKRKNGSLTFMRGF
jgi:hypothetical protein